MECKKKSFATKAEAIARMNEINSSADRRDKTPCRAYLCKDCGMVHLTSFRRKKYVEMVINGGFKKQRIERIANYWMNKKGWNLSGV